jgi:KaiC/GvpD/RAD55 family RecA-like ATPase
MSVPTVVEIRQSAALLFQPGDVVEVRVPKAGKLRTVSGYFSDFQKMAEAAAQLEVARHAGVYWTLNPVNPDLLARAANRTKGYADDTTKDDHILHRRWLPVDLDPKRPAGISSTDAEHAAALALADRVTAALIAEGWPEPVKADSGNGAHLLWRVDLANDENAELLLKNVLLALAERFNTKPDQGPPVEVDRTTFNASRIFKIYGTTARKGDHTGERPHRLSRLLHVPELLTPVDVDLLRALATSAPAGTQAKPRTQQSGPHRYSGPHQLNLRDFLNRYGVLYREPVANGGGWKYVLEECPFNPEHRAPDSAAWEYPNGYGFKCFHNSCADNDWRAFREHFEGPRPQHSYAGPMRTAPPRDEDAPPDIREHYCNGQPWPPDSEFAAAIPEGKYVRTLGEEVEDAGGLTEFWNLAKFTGIPTPFRRLNTTLAGGLRNGEVYVLGANQGAGKTSLGLQCALAAMRKRYGVLIFSMEMGRREVFQRMAAIEAHVDLLAFRESQLRKMENQEDRLRLARATAEIDGWNPRVSTKPAITPEYVISETKRLAKRAPVDLVICDHMQLMEADKSTRGDYEKFTAISRAMKQTAVEVNVPVLLVSQTSRSNSRERRAELDVADLRGSGAIEEDAAGVFLLFEDQEDAKAAQSTDGAKRYTKGPVRCFLKVGKNRYGEQGRCLMLQHYKAQTRFEICGAEDADGE